MHSPPVQPATTAKFQVLVQILDIYVLVLYGHLVAYKKPISGNKDIKVPLPSNVLVPMKN